MSYDYLSFDSKFKDSIISGSKYQTLRFDLEEVPSEGEIREAVLDTGEVIGDIRITQVSTHSVRDIASMNLSGHKNYSDTEDVISHLNEYYHNTITPSSELVLIEFQYLGDHS